MPRSVRQRAGVWSRRAFVRLYLWACHRLYNELAWSYDLASWLISGGGWAAWRRCALDYLASDLAGDLASPFGGGVPLPAAGGPRVLEVGFGTGELLIEMAGRGLRAYGLEASPAMQRITAGKMRRQSLSAPRVRALAERPPFAAACFDAVVATFPAEYIGDPAALREFARLLRPPARDLPGGRLVVVGLGVIINRPWLRRLFPIFFSPPDEPYLRRWLDALEATGLGAHVIMRREGWVTLPVVVGERDG